ncbi:sugar phosphate isomerase/epimerase (plasmid) [Deinococcus sp. KNUC1210]|uniref:sugar phosphate isomerase/epimerase family protein n=1 Tax=Deinococcus sp. KNUC1210 TaxID=2917691 RepID=UPI001EF0E76D|nr:sugar phosphate isomerase/epimerase [Deinococcus sp. KNUC1210]ULH17221.1 sugar phosphate isomerase/epimerase [Deinococcus sp. KNUC1210]
MTELPVSHPGTLSVQLYTFRDAVAQDTPGSIARLAQLGFRYVEPFGLGTRHRSAAERMESVKTLRRTLDEHGIQASSVHAAAPVGPETEAILDELEVLGSRLTVVSWPGEVWGFERDALATLEGTQRFAEAMNTAAANAAGRGLKLGYHNHWWEWNTLENGQSAYDTLLSLLDPAVFTEVDTYWAQTAGQDPATLLHALGGRTLALHLKDGPAQPEVPQVPLGGGVVDYRAAIMAAPSARWHVLEMDASAGDAFEDVGQSAQTLIAAGLSAWEA